MKRSFTLIELIVVIIIVGVLAALGINQYSRVVERGRAAEAKVRIGAMRQLVYEYYLNNGSLTGLSNDDIGAAGWVCQSSDYFFYYIGSGAPTKVLLAAGRCTANGKRPNYSKSYFLQYRFCADTNRLVWNCYDYESGAVCAALGYPTYRGDCDS